MKQIDLTKAALASVLICTVALLAGCDSGGTSTVTAKSDSAPTPVANITLCGACGHDKGSAQCCSDECESCEKCGLHVGSDLCCAVSEDLKGKDMCASCGHAAGSEECCSDECESCEKCGLHVGSPLCCKLESSHADHDHAEGHDHGDHDHAEGNEHAHAEGDSDHDHEGNAEVESDPVSDK